MLGQKTDRERAFELAEEEQKANEISDEQTEQLVKTINSKLKKKGKSWIRYTGLSKVDQKEVFDSVSGLRENFSVSEIGQMLKKAPQTIQEILDRPPVFPPKKGEEAPKETTEIERTIQSAESAILADFGVSLKQLFNEDLVLGRQLRARLGGLSPEARVGYISDAIKFYENKNKIQEAMLCFVRQIEYLKRFISDMKENVNEFVMEE